MAVIRLLSSGVPTFSHCARGAVLLLFSVSVCAAQPWSPGADSLPVPDSMHSGYLTDFARVDRYPYPVRPVAIPWPPDAPRTGAHYIICAAKIDVLGRVDSILAFGCEGEKGVLCDRVEAFLPTVAFVPARRGRDSVPVSIVFPVLFDPAVDSCGRMGPPVVGNWEEQCAYNGRIYGSAELPADRRPRVTRRVDPRYPALARASGQSGEAKLNVVVGPDGVPCFVLCEAVRPLGRGFLEAAVRAAWATGFEPGVEGGLPQAVWTVLTYIWEP